MPSISATVTSKDGGRQLGFVNAGVSLKSDKVEMAQKEVQAAMFGGLARKRDEDGKKTEDGGENGAS
ncbi:hypothetical protein F2Q69_00022130 [Brassica cretica]|uniref:Uncharacterized protein n=1 Tax=Brassica cretica TaxID=69181 RepID=A0A8S9Q998_BRACR|nr:hypothetical protein F2Q69_00022130 [Brassica cretica]